MAAFLDLALKFALAFPSLVAAGKDVASIGTAVGSAVKAAQDTGIDLTDEQIKAFDVILDANTEALSDAAAVAAVTLGLAISAPQT